MNMEKIIQRQQDLETGCYKGEPVTDETIKKYCKKMNYDLLKIRKRSFFYQRADGQQSALLKAAACS